MGAQEKSVEKVRHTANQPDTPDALAQALQKHPPTIGNKCPMAKKTACARLASMRHTGCRTY